jgi:predicted transglutaminase-like protease
MVLKENGIDSYDDLKRKASAASGEFHAVNERLKSIGTRQREIAELQRHIGTYGKTRDVYKQYLNAKSREKFFEEHRADITLHKAAKKYFDEQGYGKDKKLPMIASLKQEWATLAAEKKKLYSGYHSAKSNMTDLLTSKSNADKILGVKPNAHNLDGERSLKRSNSHKR